MSRPWIGWSVGAAVLLGVLIFSELALAQFADSTRRSMGNLAPNPSRRSMGNLAPNPSRRSMGNLLPETRRSPAPESSDSGSATVVLPNPYYPGYYYSPGYYYAPYAVYPGYGPYVYPYGYARDYYHPRGYYHRYYVAPPPLFVPAQTLFGPQATRRFMGR
ncbi:MAG: hypothetical protein GX639_22630 [Fibrobacter sp.]|nr:hypothetical protein [Fibrobacter sp.]